MTLVLIVSGIFTYSRQIADLEIQKAQGLVGDIAVQASAILAEATPSMLLTLRIGMGLVPMVCLVTAYTVIRRKYIISEEKYDEILLELGA